MLSRLLGIENNHPLLQKFSKAPLLSAAKSRANSYVFPGFQLILSLAIMTFKQRIKKAEIKASVPGRK